MVQEKKNRPCADCGERYPPYVMDFDHLGDKVAPVSYMVPVYGSERILAEIAKCEVVCSNCHRLRTYRRFKMGAAPPIPRRGEEPPPQESLPGLG